MRPIVNTFVKNCFSNRKMYSVMQKTFHKLIPMSFFKKYLFNAKRLNTLRREKVHVLTNINVYFGIFKRNQKLFKIFPRFMFVSWDHSRSLWYLLLDFRYKLNLQVFVKTDFCFYCVLLCSLEMYNSRYLSKIYAMILLVFNMRNLPPWK